MAKKAATSHGLGVEVRPSMERQHQLKDPDAQQERLKDIARWSYEAEAENENNARYVHQRMDRKYGKTLSESRISHLFKNAEEAGFLDRSKGASK